MTCVIEKGASVASLRGQKRLPVRGVQQGSYLWSRENPLDTVSLFLTPQKETEGDNVANSEITRMWQLSVVPFKIEMHSSKNKDQNPFPVENPHVGFKAEEWSLPEGEEYLVQSSMLYALFISLA